LNIFILDWDTKKCARYHNDKHCVKMILETAQLLCGAHWLSNSEAPYKLSHKNHPCAIWVRTSLSNYNWLCKLGLDLCEEYTYRYGKTHKSQQIIEWCINNKIDIADTGLTEAAKAMPFDYKEDDVVQSYRNYYMGEKRGFAIWSKRQKPSWFV